MTHFCRKYPALSYVITAAVIGIGLTVAADYYGVYGIIEGAINSTINSFE